MSDKEIIAKLASILELFLLYTRTFDKPPASLMDRAAAVLEELKALGHIS